MNHRTEHIIGLDVGTSSIKCVIAQIQSQSDPTATEVPEIRVIGVGSSSSRGLRKGVVINIEATVEAIAAAMSQAETMAGVSIGSVYASISGGHIESFNSHGIVAIRDKEVSRRDIEKVIEAAKAVAIPMDREILHVLAQDFTIDKQSGIKEPLGMSGVRLESHVHMVTGTVSSAQNIVKCVNRCGLGVEDIVLASLASARSVVTPEEQELGVALLDLGGGTCDITVFKDSAVQHTSVISVGGNHITNDIAAGLRTPIVSAENIKCQHGCAMSSLVNTSETIEVPSTGGRPARILSKQLLSEIIAPRLQELFGLVQRDLLRAECDSLLTSGLVLTGGGASMSGIKELAEEYFQLPVRVGTPIGVKGLTELVSTSDYSAAVGLAQYGASIRAQGKRSSGRGIISTFKKVSNWLSEHF